MHVLFAPAAGPQIGGGHVMRGLALAEALLERGVRSVFALPPWGAQILHRFADPGAAQLHALASSGDVGQIASALDIVRPDILVLDDYGLAAERTVRLARPGLTILVIDDLADRDYACDLLVDPGFGRAAADYADRIPAGCEVLAGPSYALLRASFRSIGASAASEGPVRRVFVSFGLSDVGAIAARAVALLRPRSPTVLFDVALGSDAPSLPRLRALQAQADGLLRVHADARDVASLMREADVAVGAGGSATWERCALGLPTLAVAVADNQRAMITRLAQARALLSVDAAEKDFEEALCKAFDALRDIAVRRQLGAASRALCDGEGAGRVAQALVRRAGA